MKKKASTANLAELTDKQKAFCEEYLIDFNGTAAAKRAGYSPKTARVMAQQNRESQAVIDHLGKLIQERSQRTQVTADRVITEAARIAFSDLRALFDDNGALLPVNAWPNEAAPAIASVEVDELFQGVGAERTQIGYTKKIKLWDKPRALELLGKHLKLWVDRVEASGPNGGPLQTRNDGIDLSTWTDQELEQLENLRRAAEQRSARG